MKHAKIRKYSLVILFSWIFTISCNDSSSIAFIEHEYSGCFGYSHDLLVVFTKNGEYIATLKTAGQQSKQVKLGSSQVDSLNNFIAELRRLQEEFGCTSVESYTVTTQDEIIRKEDGRCDWNGFDRLVNTLFDDSQKTTLIVVKPKKTELKLQKERYLLLNLLLDSVEKGADILIVQDGILVPPASQMFLRKLSPDQLSNADTMERQAAIKLYGSVARPITLIINTYSNSNHRP